MNCMKDELLYQQEVKDTHDSLSGSVQSAKDVKYWQDNGWLAGLLVRLTIECVCVVKDYVRSKSRQAVL